MYRIMELMTRIDIPKPGWKMKTGATVLLVGSCFAEEVGRKMRRGGFDVMVNPFGTLYNPASIAVCLDSALSATGDFSVDENSELLFQDGTGIWHSWMHHSRFSSLSKRDLVERINRTNSELSDCLHEADVLIITLGTSIIYRLKATGMLVANCHKMVDSMFVRERMNVSDITEQWTALLQRLAAVNPRLKVLFTVSPIRHKRDGFHVNQISKGILLQAVDELAVDYFPSYEIMMDELRDYRFYADDMIHPSELAVEHIWQRFQDTYFDNKTKDAVAKAEKEWARHQHRTLIL